MKRLLLLILVLFVVCSASAQSEVDSLMQICKFAPELEKPELYLELSLKIKDDSVQSHKYIATAYQLAVKNKQIPMQAKALFYSGELLYNSSEYQKAILEYKKAFTVYTEVKDTLGIVDCHKMIGLCYYNIDQGDRAISEFIEGMRLRENDTLTTAKLLSNIAMVNMRMHNIDDAIGYYRKALSLNSAIYNDEGMAVNYNGLGGIYKTLQQPDSALIYYLKATNLSKKADFDAIVLYNIAGIYMNYPDSINKAMDCLDQSWALFKKLGMYQYEAEYQESNGIILFKQGRYTSAIEAFNKCLELNDKYNRGLKIKTTCQSLLSKVYEKIGDYQSALEHMKLYILYSNSMALKEKYDQVSNLEKRYESEKKESEIERLQAKQELTMIQLQKNKQLKELGIAIALLLALFVLFIWQKYREKIKVNRILEKKNKLIEESEQELRVLNASKNKFFSIIAHDLKNPLHTILGYSYLLNCEYNQFNDNERRKFALDIHQSTNNIFRLLQNLLEWSRSQTGRLTYSPAVIAYQRVLDNSLGVLKSVADQKNITIKTGNDPELKMFADPLMIETVLRNLINNAIKFTPAGGQIEVSAKKVDDEVLISVADTGIGISEEEVQNLFRIDSKVKRKGTNDEDGSGLGLILCQEFVSKNKGKIWVESTLGKGSEFIFSIPVKAIA